MPQLPRVGEKWDCLEVISKGQVNNENGEGGYSRYINYAELQCECGKVFRVPSFWHGKRIVRDCGCGIYVRIGRRTGMTIYIRQDHRRAITQLATENKLKESDAMSLILEAGLNTLGYGKE